MKIMNKPRYAFVAALLLASPLVSHAQSYWCYISCTAKVVAFKSSCAAATDLTIGSSVALVISGNQSFQGVLADAGDFIDNCKAAADQIGVACSNDCDQNTASSYDAFTEEGFSIGSDSWDFSAGDPNGGGGDQEY
jgi:hypothetical protein